MQSELNLTIPQTAVVNARTQLVLDMAGQGAGKTENIGIQSAQMIISAPKAKGFIAANTYLQLSQTTLLKCFAVWEKYCGWKPFEKKSQPDGFFVVDRKPPAHFEQFYRLKDYRGTISFKNGAMVFVGSLDNWKAHDGKEFGWAHLDETKDTDERALKYVIISRLRQKGLYFNEAGAIVWNEGNKKEVEALGLTAYNPCVIHTSPSFEGVPWLVKMFKLNRPEAEKEIRDELLAENSFYYRSSGNITTVIYSVFWNKHNLPDNFISNQIARFTEDEIMLFVYGYPFTRSGNEYYSEFHRRQHVVDKINLDFTKRMHVTYDFNVMPYVTQIVGQIDNVVKFWNRNTGEKLEFLEGGETGFEAINVIRIKIAKEFCLKPPENETEQACDTLGLWLQENEFSGDIAVYGDASGHNRITGLPTLTQFKIIKRILSKYFANDILAKRSNIAVSQRKKLLNRIFAGKFPEIEIYFDAECELTIRDFEFLKQDANGKFKEKEVDKITGKSYEKIGHTSDAVEYFVCEVLRNYLKFID